MRNASVAAARTRRIDAFYHAESMRLMTRNTDTGGFPCQCRLVQNMKLLRPSWSRLVNAWTGAGVPALS